MGWLSLFGVVVLGFITFQRCSGLYCWSIIFATFGAALYNLHRTFELGFLPKSENTLSLSLIVTVAGLIYIPSEYAMVYAR